MINLTLSQLTVDELTKMSLKDLQEFQEILAKAVAIRKETEKQAIYERITQIASESGFSLDELFNRKAPPKKTPKIRYRNPNNKDETWTGNGRKPKWLLAYLEAGRDLEEFAV